jgi:predicted RND superfamily exporter protein
VTPAERFAGLLWDRRRALALTCAAVTALCAWQATRVGVDNSLRIWFLDDDPQLVAYRSFEQRFGSDEVVVVVFRSDTGMADDSGLALLRRAKAELTAVPGVAQVISIAEYADRIRAAGFEGDLERQVLTEAVLRDRLVSRDGTAAALVARMQPGESLDARRDRIVSDIEHALRRFETPHHLAGIGVLYVALNRLSMTDASTLFLAALVAMFALLWLLYRRLGPALLTLGSACVAMIWTMGLYGAAGRNINMVTSVMPTVVLVVCVAEMVHLLLYAASQQRTEAPRTRAVAVLGYMLKPCLLNTVTSALAFAALVTSPLPAVRDLGMFTAGGLLGGFASTLIGALFALSWRRGEPCPGRAGWTQRAALAIGRAGTRWPTLTLAAACVAIASAGVTASRVVVDTFTLEFLSPEHRVRRDSAVIERHLAPYVPMEFLVNAAPEHDPPALLPAIERWQRRGERLPGVGWSRSSVDDARAGLSLEPRTGADGAQRVTFSVRMQSAKSVEHTMRALLEDAQLPPGASVEPAGYLPLYVRMTEHIVRSQLSGFALAFAAVFGIIAVAFRCARIAALALPSNLVPVLALLGVMGAAGIRVDAATATIAAVVLGLVVNDTVHFLHRLSREFERHASWAEALGATLAGTGHAIVLTTVVMTLGFSVFALSAVASLAHFGLLIALGMAIGMLTDLLLLPALVMAWRRP